MAKRHIDFTKQTAEVKLAAHAIGLDHKRPYTRHGRRFFQPYRNYFTVPGDTPDWEIWNKLCEDGLADLQPPGKNMKLFRFNLTRAGLDWLGATLGITIHDKED